MALATKEKETPKDIEEQIRLLLEGEFTYEKAEKVLDSVITPEGGEEGIHAVVRELMDSTNIEMKSDLAPNQITAITAAFWAALYYRSPALLTYLFKLLKLLVSKDRLGRKELAGAIAATLSYQLQLEKAKKVEV